MKLKNGRILEIEREPVGPGRGINSDLNRKLVDNACRVWLAKHEPVRKRGGFWFGGTASKIL